MDPNLQEFTKTALYDAENQWDADDDFYLALAQRVGGPVLDVACGTGRLARAMAQTYPSKIALRDIAIEELNRRLAEHGFTIVAQYGDWGHAPYLPSSPEIITVCRREA